MCQQSGRDPLLPTEFLLRRIPAIHVQRNLLLPILPEHFHPHERDTDGISFFRESSTSAKALIAKAIGRGDYYVARATVQEISELGFSLKVTEGDADGHVSLPDLTPKKVSEDDEAASIKKKSLAELMSKGIVAGPMKAVDARAV